MQKSIRINTVILIFVTTLFVILTSLFPEIHAQTATSVLGNAFGGSANVIIITASNENNEIIENCLTTDPSDAEDCTNTGSQIFFQIIQPTDTASLQCTLNFAFDVNDANEPFVCNPTFEITSLPNQSGQLSLIVQGLDSNGTVISQQPFQWLQGEGGDIDVKQVSGPIRDVIDVSFNCKLIINTSEDDTKKSESFVCPSSLSVSSIPHDVGTLNVQVQAFDLNNTLIGQSNFKWTQTNNFISYQSNKSVQPNQITNSSEWSQDTGEGIYNRGLMVWNNSTTPIYFKDMDGRKVLEGDIVLKDIEPKTPEEAALNLGTLGNKWKDGEVPYYFDQTVGLSEISKIQRAMSHISEKTNGVVKFIPIDPNKLDPKDRIVFTTPKDRGLCQSHVGKIGGLQNIWFGQNCGVGNAIHEIMHALGFWHEMARYDRDSYISINYDNLPVNLRGQYDLKLCQKNIGPNQDCVFISPLQPQYDYCSIMHYGSQHPAAINPNIPVIETLKPLNCKIGQRDGLSPIDIAGLQFLY